MSIIRNPQALLTLKSLTPQRTVAFIPTTVSKAYKGTNASYVNPYQPKSKKLIRTDAKMARLTRISHVPYRKNTLKISKRGDGLSFEKRDKEEANPKHYSIECSLKDCVS